MSEQREQPHFLCTLKKKGNKYKIYLMRAIIFNWRETDACASVNTCTEADW